jgi:hypothetical protein
MVETKSPSFTTLVAAGLVAIGVWQLTVFLWTRFSWLAVLVPLGTLILLNCFNLMRHHLNGWRGLDQWPVPHGRFYHRWLNLRGVGDYYVWLAEQHGNREPWLTWAREQPSADRSER